MALYDVDPNAAEVSDSVLPGAEVSNLNVAALRLSKGHAAEKIWSLSMQQPLVEVCWGPGGGCFAVACGGGSLAHNPHILLVKVKPPPLFPCPCATFVLVEAEIAGSRVSATGKVAPVLSCTSCCKLSLLGMRSQGSKGVESCCITIWSVHSSGRKCSVGAQNRSFARPRQSNARHAC